MGRMRAGSPSDSAGYRMAARGASATRRRAAALAVPCDAARRLAALVIGAALLLLAGWLVSPAGAGAAVNTTPPATSVKLIFIHHSTGEAWLADDHGGLGIALRDNHYFVSDTNYGWGPDEIGNTTDIGHWWTWFRDPARSPAAMTVLYAESAKHCAYSRLAADPGGPNQIVMFKSCFPNSQLRTPYTPIPAIADNPLKGQSCGGADFTVANAKGIYVDLLGYFGAHPEKLFVAVVAPPVTAPDTPGGRALADWLVYHWLQDANYTTGNVFVFDYYTVLSSKTGGGSNDAGLATGNHHRVWNGAVQHITTEGADNLAYPSDGGDSHPNAAGDQKATAEFLPLLNAAYNAWKGNGDAPTPGPSPSPTPSPTPGALTVRAPYPATVKKGNTATLRFRVSQAVLGGNADVTIRIRTKAGKCVKSLKVDDAPLNSLRRAKFRCKLKRGVYRFYVSAITDAGVRAGNVASNRLTVK